MSGTSTRRFAGEAVPAGGESAYPELDLCVRKVLFAIPGENLAACILVDLANEWRQRHALAALRREVVDHANRVIRNQMKVAQEIAALLGETTAESKVSLLKLIEIIERETS